MHGASRQASRKCHHTYASKTPTQRTNHLLAPHRKSQSTVQATLASALIAASANQQHNYQDAEVGYQ
jgi:hypothetical protein